MSLPPVSPSGSARTSNALPPPPPPPLPANSVYTSCYCEENVYLLAHAFSELAQGAGTPSALPWEISVVFVSNGAKTAALWSQKARAGVVVWDYHVFLVLRLRLRPADPDTSATLGVDLQQENKEREDGGPCAPEVSRSAPSRPANSNRYPSPERQPHTSREAGVRGIGGPERRVLVRPFIFNDVELDSDSEVQEGSEGDRTWVYDFDTTLGVPCPWREYVAGTFPYAFDDELAGRIDARFLSLFRVIPADVYLDHFAFDRSHMIVSNSTEGMETEGAIDGAGPSMGPQYSMPPPLYPPLCGAKAKAMGVVNNLMASFVSMAIKPASQPAAEDIPSLDVGSGGGFAAPVDADAAAGPRRSAAAGEYGQVMDMGGFVRWLATSGTDSDSLG